MTRRIQGCLLPDRTERDWPGPSVAATSHSAPRTPRALRVRSAAFVAQEWPITELTRHHRITADRFRPHDWLDRVFEIGIVLKGLNGLAEIVGGLALLIATPSQLHGIARALTQGELSEDPNDFVATHLLHSAGALTQSNVNFGAVYLLTHGVVKVVLVAALLLNRIWAYPWMIGVLGAFIGYQLYRIALHPTAGLIGLTAFDVVIVALTLREWRIQRRSRAAAADGLGRKTR